MIKIQNTEYDALGYVSAMLGSFLTAANFVTMRKEKISSYYFNLLNDLNSHRKIISFRKFKQS